MPSRFYDLGVRRIDGTETSLSEFAGKALLVVNVASQCGLTPQYEGLERIYSSYRERGFAVLGFPSNEFAGQEPGTDAEIHDFCRSAYGVDFPMFSKIEVNGPAATRSMRR
jgi:glutathione peroxidase